MPVPQAQSLEVVKLVPRGSPPKNLFEEKMPIQELVKQVRRVMTTADTRSQLRRSECGDGAKVAT